MAVPTEQELARRFKQLSTKDLLRIAVARSDDYTPKAVQIAEEILADRDFSIESEELMALAKERIKQPESFWDRYDRQMGESGRAGWFAVLVLLGVGFLGIGVGQVADPAYEDDMVTLVMIPVLGTVFLALGIAGIVWEKRRQAREHDVE